MKTICIHWTGGSYKPNSIDLEHYHFLITNTGEVISGDCKPEDNLNCASGRYAAHCGGGNTGSIGVAMCGMWTPNHVSAINTRYPLTKIQCESCFKLCSQLAQKYNIPIDKNHIYTHYEFGQNHPNTESKGKIDINHLKCYNLFVPDDVGDFIRNKIYWYYLHK